MEDNEIITLYFSRSERAIVETDIKYGHYCKKIAQNILNDMRDTEECVNDTYLQVWNVIPPARPYHFSAFLGKITRNLSINRLKLKKTQKRGGGQYELVYEELTSLVSSSASIEDALDEKYLLELINNYLGSISLEKRMIFVGRYWYMDSISDIASKLKISESKVKMTLHRTRDGLKQFLEKEGIVL